MPNLSGTLGGTRYSTSAIQRRQQALRAAPEQRAVSAAAAAAAAAVDEQTPSLGVASAAPPSSRAPAALNGSHQFGRSRTLASAPVVDEMRGAANAAAAAVVGSGGCGMFARELPVAGNDGGGGDSDDEASALKYEFGESNERKAAGETLVYMPTITKNVALGAPPRYVIADEKPTLVSVN